MVALELNSVINNCKHYEEINLHIPNEEWLRRVVNVSLDIASSNQCKHYEKVELSLVISDDQTMRVLNRQYRGIDTSTDVLAFAFHEEEQQEVAHPFVSPPDGVLHLGEIVISYPDAVSQASKLSHSVEREIATLVTHGTLHLLGYTHNESSDTQEMQALEGEILGRIGLG